MLKTKKTISFIIALVLTAGLLTLLFFAYDAGFQLPFIFSLLGGVILTMVAWAYYYMALSKYKEAQNPNKHKYFKKGNRKESRKGTKNRTKAKRRNLKL